jgi:hypothetical protein
MIFWGPMSQYLQSLRERPSRCVFLAMLLFLSLTARAQTPTLPVALGFEAPPSGSCPGGWFCGAETIAVDSEVVHGGKWSVRIQRQADSQGPFSTITKNTPMDVSGNTIELRGYIRTENVSDFAAFWMREDTATGQPAGFATMQGRQPAHGTTPWTEYSISLPVNAAARLLVFGFLLSGPGKAWADDLELLVDGKPLEGAQKREVPANVLDRDHEFDGGSHINLTDLSPIQIDNLSTLGKVWGFLKYHHPQITAGTKHFDYELLRILPKLLSAPDRKTANDALLLWTKGLGDVNPCKPCAEFDVSKLSFSADLAWILNERLLSPELSRLLQTIYSSRPTAPQQFYVALTGVGNPVFLNEPVYNLRLPDAGFQILALYRYWNIVEYWYPYRDLVGDRNWNGILQEFLPRIALAKDRDSYQLAMMALIARLEDTHANLWSSLSVRPPVGACQLPVDVRFVENRAVVATYSNATWERLQD